MLSLVFKCISHVFQMYFSSHHILFPVSASSKWSKYNVLLSQVLHWQLRNWSHICLQPGGDDFDYADHGDWNDHDDDDDDSDEKHKWKWLFSLSKCCVGSRWSIFHRILLPLPCSAWPGYDDYEMMSVLCVFVWECICVWECVFVSFSLQTLDKSLVSHWGNVKFTCHKIFWSGSCIVVQGISKGQLQFRKALRKSGRSPVDLPGFLMAFLFIWREKKKVVDIVGFQKEHHVIFC